MSDTRSGPKTGFFGPMKGLHSARHTVEGLAGGRLRASIEHDTMKGVSPEMLRWWFENIDTWTRYNAATSPGRRCRSTATGTRSTTSPSAGGAELCPRTPRPGKRDRDS